VIWRRRARPATMLTTSYFMLRCEKITSFVKIAIIDLGYVSSPLDAIVGAE
jgi:hypothetical protein